MTNPEKNLTSLSRRLASIFTKGQLHLLREATETSGIGVLFLVALSTGLRQGELLGLHWQDLDRETRVLSVHRTVSLFSKSDFRERECELLYQRALKLPASLMLHLQRHRQAQYERCQQAGEKWKEKDLIFSDEKGNYLSPFRLRRCFQQALEAMNLPSTPFHAVRNTTISLLLMLGVEPRVVQTMLGVSWRNTSVVSITPIALEQYEDAIQKILDFLDSEGKQE